MALWNWTNNQFAEGKVAAMNNAKSHFSTFRRIVYRNKPKYLYVSPAGEQFYVLTQACLAQMQAENFVVNPVPHNPVPQIPAPPANLTLEELEALNNVDQEMSLDFEIDEDPEALLEKQVEMTEALMPIQQNFVVNPVPHNPVPQNLAPPANLTLEELEALNNMDQEMGLDNEIDEDHEALLKIQAEMTEALTRMGNGNATR